MIQEILDDIDDLRFLMGKIPQDLDNVLLITEAKGDLIRAKRKIKKVAELKRQSE